MTDKQINKFSDLTFAQFLGYDLVATFNNNRKIKDLQEQLKRKEQECNQLKQALQEIKEIAEGYISYSTNAPAGGYKQILEKISEVE